MRSIVHLLCAASALLAAACAAPAPATTPGNQPAASGARQASSPAPKGVYDDPTWQELIAAARQEGKLVVASGPNPDMRVQLPAAFKDRFGIELLIANNQIRDELGGIQYQLATGLTGVFQASRQLELFAEWDAYYVRGGLASTLPEHYAVGGLVYFITPNLAVDARAGVGLNHRSNDVLAGVGFAIRH